MERDFVEISDKIMEAAEPEFREFLARRRFYWAPEIRWVLLSQAVQQHVRPDSKDPKSIKIYSILTGLSLEEQKKIFERDGF